MKFLAFLSLLSSVAVAQDLPTFCLNNEYQVITSLNQYLYQSECNEKLSNGKFKISESILTVFVLPSERSKLAAKNKVLNVLAENGLKSVLKISDSTEIFLSDSSISGSDLCLVTNDTNIECAPGATLETDPLKNESPSVILERSNYSVFATIPGRGIGVKPSVLYKK